MGQVKMTFRYEYQKIKQGYTHIVGCDEVGKGSLAGPVVACALIFDLLKVKEKKLKIQDIKDSKLLSAETREKLSNILKTVAVWSIGVVSQDIIDKINIHQATLLAMRRAVKGLFSAVIPNFPAGVCGKFESEYPLTIASSEYKKLFPACSCSPALSPAGIKRILVAIDGIFTIPDLPFLQEPIVGGDNKIVSIAAASIIAKVHRDNVMVNYHRLYPVYGFNVHKGYGTFDHRQKILRYGLTDIHRKSFCRNLILKGKGTGLLE